MDISFKNKRILVVDDEQLMLDIVKTLIVSHGGEAETLMDGANVMSVVRDRDIDMVILDRYMPDSDGYHVLRKLKEEERTKDVPVVMLTGEKCAKEIHKAIQAGACGYVAKPFQPISLLNQISRIFQVAEHGSSVDDERFEMAVDI